MNIDSYTSLYCLIGHPISKSLSPLIHNTIFMNNSVNARYLAFEVKDKKGLENVIKGFKALGVKGFNVTMPYKVETIKYLDEIDESAKILGAVNTVINVDGRLKGFNTDGDGFIKSLVDSKFDPKNKRIILLGAGGASRAIAVSLAIEGINELTIINRSIENAEELKLLIENNFTHIKVNCYTSEQETNIPSDVDLLVNTTPVGMYPDVDKMPISPDIFSEKTIFYDIIYKPIKTKVLLEAERLGHITISGLDMLINQAIYSQQIWISCSLVKNVDWNVIKKKVVEKIK